MGKTICDSFSVGDIVFVTSGRQNGKEGEILQISKGRFEVKVKGGHVAWLSVTQMELLRRRKASKRSGPSANDVAPSPLVKAVTNLTQVSSTRAQTSNPQPVSKPSPSEEESKIMARNEKVKTVESLEDNKKFNRMSDIDKFKMMEYLKQNWEEIATGESNDSLRSKVFEALKDDIATPRITIPNLNKAIISLGLDTSIMANRKTRRAPVTQSVQDLTRACAETFEELSRKHNALVASLGTNDAKLLMDEDGFKERMKAYTSD